MENTEINDDLIARLKREHGEITTVTVPLDDEETKFVTILLKRPDRQCNALVTKLMEGDSLKAVEAFLKNCWVGGDSIDKIAENFRALKGCGDVVLEMLSGYKITIKKN